MIKHKFFFDYEKEEKWLNSMARQGELLTGTNFCGRYTFITKEPRDCNFRLDYRVFKSEKDFIDYRTMFEDSGWKHIAGGKNSGVQYFVKVDGSAADDIFSDKVSKAGRYKRLSSMWLSLLCIYMPITAVMISSGNIKMSVFTNPAQLYYTPGLWEMSGFRFWRAFLFETPFAMGRGFAWVLFPVIMLVYLYFALRSQRMYNKYLKMKEM